MALITLDPDTALIVDRQNGVMGAPSAHSIADVLARHFGCLHGGNRPERM